MSITVTTSGSGSLGELKPGWSVEEFATPVNPVSTAGGTGTVSYGASDGVESLMLIGDDATFSESDLGDISGVIRSVTQARLSLGVGQDNKLARFDATANIPPVIVGCVPCALDLADQLTGTVRLIADDGTFWSMAGHLSGFDNTGKIVPFSQQRTSFTYYNNTTGNVDTVNVTAINNSVWSNSFTNIGAKVFSTATVGDSIVPGPVSYDGVFFFIGATKPYTASQIAFKTLLNGQDVSFAMQGQPAIGATQGSGQLITFNIDYSAETITINSEYWSGGIVTNSSDTASIASLDVDAELAVFFNFYPWQGSSFQNNYKPQLNVCNTSDYSTVVNVGLDYNTDGRDAYFDPWEISGNVRAVWRKQFSVFAGDPSWEPVIEEYEAPANFSYTQTPQLGSPSRGVSDNIWQWLQDACAVYKWEIALEGDAIIARPIGGRILDVDNYSPIPGVTPALAFTGRQVDVNYSQAQAVFEGEVYNARDDDNRIISVGAGQTTSVTVGTDVYLFSAIDPTRVTTFIPGVGTYFVVDSTGLPIVADQWEDYGGAVRVAPSASNPSGIDVTLVGPSVEIPSTTAPYTLAVSDGENQYAALSIYGSGVVYDPKVLNLLTASTPSKTPQQVATSVDNAFIATLQDAYDTGIWASVDASGPVVGLTLTIPTSSVSAFGATPGSLIEWQLSQYRVMSSRMSKMSAELTCTRHVTVADFDAIWSGETVGDHDAVWDGYEAKDQIVYPYKTS